MVHFLLGEYQQECTGIEASQKEPSTKRCGVCGGGGGTEEMAQ